MARQWQLLLIALLLALMIVKGVATYSDDDDEEDDEYFDDEYFDDDEDEYYYGEQKPKLNLNREEVIINTFTRAIQFQPPSYVPKTLYATTVTVKDTSVTTVTVKDNVVTKITEPINPVVGTPDDVPPVSVDPNESDSLNTPNVGSGTLDFEGLEAPLQDDTCSSTGLTNEIFRRFTGIFFGDFYTYGGTDILGPLAVKGTFIAPDYVVNGNQGTDCSAKNSVQSYGLVVGGAANTRNTQVHGSIFVGGGGDLTQLKQLENSCIVTGTQGTGLVDFIALEKEAVRLNGIYREHSPTLQLQSDGSLKRLASNDQSVEYLTFNSCNDRATCQNIWNGQMSIFDNMFGGVGNWNGIQGSIKPDASLTYVLNIPVIEDTTITLSSNQPVNGFNPCKLVLNFYPVKKTTGAYSPTGAFTILRNSAGQLGGLILSPRGNIRDGTTGNFAGNTIALSYTWAFTNGVELRNFQAAGGNCSFFSGCNPDPPDEGTPPVVTPSSCGNSTSTTTSLTTLTERFTVTNDVTKEIRVLTTQTDTTTKTDSFTETKTNNYTTTKTDSFTETTTDKFTETKTDNYTTTKTDSYTTTKTDSFTETNNVAATATVTITSTTDHDVTSTATTTDTTTATTTEVSLTTSTATTTQVSLDTTTEVSLSTTTEVSLSTTTEVSLSTTTEVSLSTTTEVSLSTTTEVSLSTTTETTTLTTGRPPIVGGGGGPYSGGEDIETTTETEHDTVTVSYTKTLGVASAPTVGDGLSSTVTVTVTNYPIASVPPSESLTFVFTETLTYTRTFDENNGHYHGQQHDESCAYSHEEEDGEDDDDEDEDDDSCDEDEGDEDDDDDIDHYMKHNFHKQH